MERIEESRRFAGSPLLPLAVIHVLLFAASLAVGAILRHGPSFAIPTVPSKMRGDFLPRIRRRFVGRHFSSLDRRCR